MAKEITYGANLSVSKNGASMAARDNDSTINMAGDTFIDNVQAIGTISEALVFGDITNMGYVRIKNLDVANPVYISQTTPAATGTALIKLLPGEPCAFPSRQTTIYAIAVGGTVNVRVTASSL
jgi:hypothetical protein